MIRLPALRRLCATVTPAKAALLSVLLSLPALGVGYQIDDWQQQVLIRADAGAALTEMFTFMDPDRNAVLREAGVLPWWTPPEAQARFFRPLSAATHLLDHAVAPGSAVVAHLHSLLWAGALVWAAGLLLVRVLGRRSAAVAGLAVLLYAVDDAHGMPVGWLANRNALIAGVLGISAVLAHIRSREDGWRPGGLLSPLLLLAGLLAGESALAATAWLAAHALTLDRAPLVPRLRALLPAGVVVVGWRIAYNLMGYGSAGSGLYLDPVASPVAFLRALPVRLSALLADQFLGLPSLTLSFVEPSVQRLVLVLVVPALGWALWRLSVLLRSDATARFWAAGLLLSALPICATFPAARLLTFVGIGGAAIVAMAAERVLWTPGGEALRGRGVVSALLGLHLLVAPLMLPVQAGGVRVIADTLINLCHDAIPTSPDIVNKTVVFVNANELCVGQALPQRAIRGGPSPRAVRLLASAHYDLEVQALDRHTIEISIAGGMQSVDADTLMQPANTPLPIGSVVPLSDMRVEVVGWSAAGRVDRIRVQTNAPLDDPSMVWVVARDAQLQLVDAPSPGTTWRLPGVFTWLSPWSPTER